jgi:hypothetical protein
VTDRWKLAAFTVAGELLGAIPMTVVEFLQPQWGPKVLTAFGVPMCAGAALGSLAWLLLEFRRSP